MLNVPNRPPPDLPDAHIKAWHSWWMHEVGEHLVGTPSSIPQAAQELGHPEWEGDIDADELDSITFECTHCGWWCRAEECCDDPETGEWICDECEAELE